MITKQVYMAETCTLRSIGHDYDSEYVNISQNLVSVLLERSNVSKGESRLGGGISVYFASIGNDISCVSQEITSKLSISNCEICNNIAFEGGSNIFIYGQSYISNNVVINNSCIFGDDNMGGVDVRYCDTNCKWNHETSILLINTNFHMPWFSIPHEIRIIFVGVTFLNSAIVVSNMRRVMFTDSKFIKSARQSALMVAASNVYFQGNIFFQDNTGVDGGAISICEKSCYLRNQLP